MSAARVTVTVSGDLGLHWMDEGEVDMNYTHLFVKTLRVGDVALQDLGVEQDDILISGQLADLFRVYEMWRARDLRSIAAMHRVRVSNRDNVQELRDTLGLHLCDERCMGIVVVMRTLRYERSEEYVQRVRREAFPEADAVEGEKYQYLEIASAELRRGIIGEWQELMSTARLRLEVCAVCGRKTKAEDIRRVDVDKLNLDLLQNEDLPAMVYPTTYDFELYGRALLHPSGMTERWSIGAVVLCGACEGELCGKGRMPKFALANWLYYGYDELPCDVMAAFKDATQFERVLVSRARASKISFRFSELKGHVMFGTDPAVSQRCVKGNVMVMPQDATHLNDVLPPPPEVLRDTVCTVFVGRTKPSKDTIARLGPVLVRKSRVRRMIAFLTEHNLHYRRAPDFGGLSETNMNLLFRAEEADEDVGIPCAMEIGFLEESEAIRGATADYATRDDGSVVPGDDDEMLMENVGYTDGDETALTYRQMKMRALKHCLMGGKFVRSQAGSQFVPDFQNPRLLSWLFPHLDPWGIGGFFEPTRKVQLTLEEQLAHLLQVHGYPFAGDPDFAFVYFNIMQKKAACDSVNFRVKVSQQQEIVRKLLSINVNVLQRLIDLYESDPKYEPVNVEERSVLHVLGQVRMVGRDLPGTAAYKVTLRNEIRSLVNFKGTPALFVTLNPSDVNHPLVRLFAGHNVSLEDAIVGEELTEWQRKLLAARNPVACALFFNTMMNAFIRVILRYGRPGRGLFGNCSAYFGTVEAQGRGTLHCHMLIWLEGHPSPQRMRELMVDSEQYQQDMFHWLESIIKSELLGTRTVVEEVGGVALPRPRFEDDARAHPGCLPLPSIVGMPQEEFEEDFERVVNDLVKAFNWHQHTETCWKYLRRSDPRDDAHCRMRMDGTTRAESAVDEETGSILLRRLHPRIANYNDIVIFLLQANMDIKHIGSGQGAKALLYYVTDYITKAALPTHVGLAALLYAIQRASERFDAVELPVVARSRSALTMTVNRMRSRQEISHQQVMSYLVGGGDHYTSHCYRVLYFGAFDRMFKRVWGEVPWTAATVTLSNVSGDGTGREGDWDDVVDVEMDVEGMGGMVDVEGGIPTVPSDGRSGLAEADEVMLYLGSGSISAVTQQQDYMLRGNDPDFGGLCLYEFVGMVEKITRRSEDARRERRETGGRRGRREEPRGAFDQRHPQYETHVLRKRTVWVVPVVLGDRVPRHDRGDEEKEQWARMMMILFVPWKNPADIKYEGETWRDAYERRRDVIGPQQQEIIRNMNVLSECRDARDEVTQALRANKERGREGGGGPDLEDVTIQVERVRRRYESEVFYDELDGFGVGSGAENVREAVTLTNTLDHTFGARVRDALDLCRVESDGCSGAVGGAVVEVSEGDDALLATETSTMRELKRKRRPEVEAVAEHRPRKRRRVDVEAAVSVDELQNDSRDWGTAGLVDLELDSEALLTVIQQVIIEKGLHANAEQLRAFEIVAHHACFGSGQLLMYIGGVGGTGKTYVVQAILRLFALLGRRNEVMIGAPTGAAARLVGGHTIHSLTMLPDSKKKKDLRELVNTWRGKEWMIADEISMVGGRFMSQWSTRIQQAKGDEGVLAELPFGGVNMIFLGDFGQLRPVKQAALYSYRLVSSPGLEACRDERGVSALMGAYLWRSVQTVVMLRRNQRQSEDPEYAALLSRVRVGQCVTNTPGVRSDIEVLRGRELVRLANREPGTLSSFRDAPVIVGRKKIRDLLNARLIEHHARQLQQEVHLYHSQDSIARAAVVAEVRGELWRLPSSACGDAPGRLPLFPGMKVMVQENLAFSKNVVNGAEGIVRDIKYRVEEGRRVAVAVYVQISGAGRVCEGLEDDVVPIFPETTSFKYVLAEDGVCCQKTVSRLQVPLLPAYAYTDYKSQGKTLERAIVDLESAQSIQGIYVMLSRVKSLRGIAILRPFSPEKLQAHISEELRVELRRLERLDQDTARAHAARMQPVTMA